jgi:glycosyltransferase involved in cell wall biosynthesis
VKLNENLRRDIFCLPSRQVWHRVLGGHGCLKPAVGNLGTGAEDLIQDGRTNLLVPREDVESLAGALKRLMSDVAWAQKLGEAGAITWQFMGNSASKYLELYKSTMNSF